jgi:protein SCO1/2
MNVRAAAVAVLCLAFALPARAAERHAAFGLVLQVDAARRTFVASCQEIPGYMEAMAMPFTVRDAKELEGLPRDVLVDFTVVVEKGDAYAENIRVHTFASPEAQAMKAERLMLLERLTASGPAAKPLERGQTVPDFELIDQDRHTVALSALAGKVVAVSFMYTKCRLPGYCLRLTHNFGELQKRFARRLGRDLILLTISFDPGNDSPEILAAYAKEWKADSKTWHLLTGPEDEVRRVCHALGLSFWPDMGMITHTLHTIVIDRGGRVAADLEGNEFTPEQLGDLVQSVMDR